jgi:hypothetical protein
MGISKTNINKACQISAGASVVSFVVSALFMGFGHYSEEAKTMALKSDLRNIALEIEQTLAIEAPQAATTPASSFVKPSTPVSDNNTTIRVMGNSKDGYCIIATNPEIHLEGSGLQYTSNPVRDSVGHDVCNSDVQNATTVIQGLPLEDTITYADVSTGGFLGAGGLVVLSGAGGLVNSFRKFAPEEIEAQSKIIPLEPPKKEISKETVNGKRIENLILKVEALTSEWASYEMDLAKLLEYPSVTNMSIQSTSEFHKALRQVQHIIELREFSDDEEYNAFRLSVLDLEHKFDVMISEAKRTKWNSYSAGEQHSLRIAKSLLAIALNSASTSHERQVAYKRLVKEVEGIIALPEKTMLLLESKVAPGITVGDFNAMSMTQTAETEKV